MNKIISIILALLLISSFKALASDLEYVRARFDKAVGSAEVCKDLMQKLAGKTDPASLAYLGAAETIWANHTSNPLSKLNTFRKGVKKIEQAVAKDPNNVEVRFIRYSIQKNCPDFLGYSDNLSEDKNFIVKNKGQVKSAALLSMIQKVL